MSNSKRNINTRYLSGSKVRNVVPTTILQDKINILTPNDINAGGFEAFIHEIISNDAVFDQKTLLLALQLGQEFSNTESIEQYFWCYLMKFECSPEDQINDNILEHLLKRGFEVGNRKAWNLLALLMKMIYGSPKTKQKVIELIRNKFNSVLGRLFDSLEDFQQANYVVELLSNCFPRKSTTDVGVVRQPVLWRKNLEKNDQLFKNQLYPFRGKHGEQQVLDFIWNFSYSRFEYKALRLRNIIYNTTNNKTKPKSLKEKKIGYCYTQVIDQSIYLWNGEGQFLVIPRVCFLARKKSKLTLELQIQDGQSADIKSTNEVWLKSLGNISWFQLDCLDFATCNAFFNKLRNIRKVSEVLTFLGLHKEYENKIELPETSAIKNGNVNTSPFYESISNNFSKPGVTNIVPNFINTDNHPNVRDVAAPELSDLSTLNKKHKRTPDNKKNSELDRENMVQKHENSCVIYGAEKQPNSVNQLRRRHKMESQVIPPQNCNLLEGEASRNSVVVESPNAANIPVNDMRTRSRQSKSDVRQETKKVLKTKKIKSIGTRDIHLLDTIFGAQTQGTKPKRQKRQDDPKKIACNTTAQCNDRFFRQTRSEKKKNITNMRVAESSASLQNVVTTKIQKDTTNDITSPKNAGMDQLKDISHEDCHSKTTGSCNPNLAADVKKNIKSSEGRSKCAPQENLTQCYLKDDSLESTTVIGNSSSHMYCPEVDIDFTNKLKENISFSIEGFSNELIKKVTIINDELNRKISEELSNKYHNLFLKLQESFQSDTENLLTFVKEMKNMINLSEDELLNAIKNKRFNPH